MAEALKERISPAGVRSLAAALAAADASFPRERFEREASAGLGRLELKARIAHVADALARALPADFAAAAALVERSLDGNELGMWELWPVTVWAGDGGRAHVRRAAGLLETLTPYASGEFGVRPLIDAEPQTMREIVARWTGHPDEHVRRLASEGPRPLLPWAPRLALSAGDPGWGLALLDPLVDDNSEYVRRSVANHLNDVCRLDRRLAIETAAGWRERGSAGDVLRHGLRTLIKAGDAEALVLCGFDPEAAVEVETLELSAAKLSLGETLEFSVVVRADGAAAAAAYCSYAIVFARPSGRTTRKRFKLAELALAPGERRTLRRTYTLRDRSIRTHHPGRHALEVEINGVVAASRGFTVAAPRS